MKKIIETLNCLVLAAVILASTSVMASAVTEAQAKAVPNYAWSGYLNQQGYGNVNEQVRAMQYVLNGDYIGASLTTDGNYGPATETAVKSFQTKAGVTADGLVGPVTWGKLQSRIYFYDRGNSNTYDYFQAFYNAPYDGYKCYLMHKVISGYNWYSVSSGTYGSSPTHTIK